MGSQLDVDGDTNIHLSEFLAAATGANLLRSNGIAHEAFSHFDLDQNGKIDLGELTTVLGSRFCGVPTHQIFSELDKNGDLSVDIDEFSSVIAEQTRTTACLRASGSSTSEIADGSPTCFQPETEPPPG